MMGALARLAGLRVLRTRRTWLPMAAWTGLALGGALLLRTREAFRGADQILRGPYALVIVPLVAYTVAAAAVGGTGLRSAIRPVVALGATTQRAALATTLVAMAAGATLCGLLGFAVSMLAHGAGDAPLARDLFASTWIGALGGAAYAAFFVAGSAIGRGGARALFLIGDFFLGATAGAASIVTPRGHVQSLLGGPLAADLSQRASSGLLVVLAVGYAALAVSLSRRK